MSDECQSLLPPLARESMPIGDALNKSPNTPGRPAASVGVQVGFTPTALVPVRRRALSDQVVAQLTDTLMTARVGDRLPTEPELMIRFQVGRSTIREAVRSLVNLGIVEVRVGDGTYLVALPNEIESLPQRLRRTEIKEIFDLKLALELQVARLATLHRTQKDLARIQKMADLCQKCHDEDNAASFAEADYQFHVAIANAARTNLVADLYSTVRKILQEKLVSQNAVSKQLREAALSLHEDLARAVAEKDVHAAQAVWLKQPNPHDCA